MCRASAWIWFGFCLRPANAKQELVGSMTGGQGAGSIATAVVASWSGHLSGTVAERNWSCRPGTSQPVLGQTVVFITGSRLPYSVHSRQSTHYSIRKAEVVQARAQGMRRWYMVESNTATLPTIVYLTSLLGDSDSMYQGSRKLNWPFGPGPPAIGRFFSRTLCGWCSSDKGHMDASVADAVDG